MCGIVTFVFVVILKSPEKKQEVAVEVISVLRTF